jgi:hypothetical protein
MLPIDLPTIKTNTVKSDINWLQPTYSSQDKFDLNDLAGKEFFKYLDLDFSKKIVENAQKLSNLREKIYNLFKLNEYNLDQFNQFFERKKSLLTAIGNLKFNLFRIEITSDNYIKFKYKIEEIGDLVLTLPIGIDTTIPNDEILYSLIQKKTKSILSGTAKAKDLYDLILM